MVMAAAAAAVGRLGLQPSFKLKLIGLGTGMLSSCL